MKKNVAWQLFQNPMHFLMAFEVVEGFLAIKAAVHAFAGGGAKLAYQLRMIRFAARARNGFFGKQFVFAKLLLRIWRGNAKGF